MFNPIAVLWAVLFFTTGQHVLASRDTLPEELPNTPDRTPWGSTPTPFVDNLAEEISLAIHRPNLISEKPYKPTPYDHREKQITWPFYNPYVSPIPLVYSIEAYNQAQEGLLKVVVDQFKADLQIIQERQNLLKNYTESACPNSEDCKKVPEVEADDDISGKGYRWRPAGNLARSEEIYSMMLSMRTAVEKLTLRQNMLYEYASCACVSTSECSTSTKPVVDLMFTNNSNISAEIINHLLFPAKSPASNFFTNFFSQVPNFSNWLNMFNFNPLSSIFAYPYSIFNPSIYSPGSFWTYFKPTFSSSSFHASTTGPSSTLSSGSSSKPGGENYVINHPGGGTTHISSNSDNSGSSISVLSTSNPSKADRDARQVIFGGPPQASPGFANQAAMMSLGGGRPGVPGSFLNPAGPYFGGGHLGAVPY